MDRRQNAEENYLCKKQNGECGSVEQIKINFGKESLRSKLIQRDFFIMIGFGS